MIMTTASTILKIDELPTKDIHYHEHFTGNGDTSSKSNHSKGSFDYLKTMYFDITYRPTDGLSNQEIKRITDFVLNSDKILYYSMGVEVKGGKIKTCHLHIHVVMKVMCRYGDIDKMFEPLMKGERVAPKPDIALKVTTCKRNEVKNKTVLLHSVYPLKDAARDKAAHEITSEHWNNRITTWTNIFDGKKDCMGDELDWWKWKEDRFKHLLFKKFHTNHKETITITSGNAVRMMKEYASKKNIPYSLNQRAAIIAEMVTDTTDTVNYEETIIKGKVKTAINGIKEEDHYKPSLLKLLQDHYDKGDELLGRIVEETRSPADIETINALTRQIAKLEKMNGNLEKRIITMGEGNVDVHKKWTATKKKLNERDEELALAVMEIEDIHPMRDKSGGWKTLGHPEAQFGGYPEIVLIAQENFEKTKKRFVEEWRSKPHFKLEYDKKRPREVCSTGGQKKKPKQCIGNTIFGRTCDCPRCRLSKK